VRGQRLRRALPLHLASHAKMKKKPRIVIKLHLHGLALTINGDDLPSRKSLQSSQLGIKDIHTEDLSIRNHLPQLSAQSFYFGKFRHMLSSKNFFCILRFHFFCFKKNKFFFKKIEKNIDKHL
jgi:hypothetical protein